MTILWRWRAEASVDAHVAATTAAAALVSKMFREIMRLLRPR
jgi:hypothetical protein